MSANHQTDLGERLRNSDLVQQAITTAVREAVRRHKLLGHPVATMRDGKVVWVPAEEIQLPPETNGKSASPHA
jgi:hypothetical protein